MPENVVKMARSASPVARAGAGDISERELSRERHTLQTTPPARLQPMHRKKQLFLTPVSKLTASATSSPSPHLARIRTCLGQLSTPRRQVDAVPRKMPPKASSMEDLTPTKRMRREMPKIETLPIVRSPSTLGGGADVAAARVARFMVVSAWRRRRSEVRCLRKTLETQVSCSERLRLQVVALKSLLDSDNAKVRLAMKELERLKQLVRDKDKEKAVLEREKLALENDISAAEDRASEMSIGWRNCRNELDLVRAGAVSCERALAGERAAAAESRTQRDHAIARLAACEDELSQLEEQVTAAEEDAEASRADLELAQAALRDAAARLSMEHNGRLACGIEIAALKMVTSRTETETATLRGQLQRAEEQLRLTKEQLDWWPAPLTKLVGAMRWWAGRASGGSSLRAALLWSCVPPTHGATTLTHLRYTI